MIIENFFSSIKNLAIFLLFSYSQIIVKWNDFWKNPGDSMVIKYILDIAFFLKKYYCKILFDFRIEPIYTEWIQICKLSDNKYHEFYYDISDCDKEEIMNSFEELANDINEKEVNECLAIIKNESHNYHVRILYPTISKNKFASMNSTNPIFLQKTNKNSQIVKGRNVFLDISYWCPGMKDSINLEVDRGMYLENNQLFSPLFIKRCLEYQSKPYRFNKYYKITLYDMNLKKIKMGYNEYIHITKNNQYEVCKII